MLNDGVFVAVRSVLIIVVFRVFVNNLICVDKNSMVNITTNMICVSPFMPKYVIYYMSLSQKCSKGGLHNFRNISEYGFESSKIVKTTTCVKCKVFQEHKTSVRIDSFTFKNCSSDKCQESKGGHVWVCSSMSYTSPSYARAINKCVACSGERHDVFGYDSTEYSGLSAVTPCV